MQPPYILMTLNPLWLAFQNKITKPQSLSKYGLGLVFFFSSFFILNPPIFRPLCPMLQSSSRVLSNLCAVWPHPTENPTQRMKAVHYTAQPPRPRHYSDTFGCNDGGPSSKGILYWTLTYSLFPSVQTSAVAHVPFFFRHARKVTATAVQ